MVIKTCKWCGKKYQTSFLKSEHCSKKCYGNTFSKRGRIPLYFSDKMIGYDKDEIKRAYHAFVSWESMTKVVPCKCHNGFMCYPHWLELKAKIYNPSKYYFKY